MKVNLSALKTSAYHFGAAFVAALVPQLFAVNGHLGRDAVISAVAGAASAAERKTFPNGMADIKALLIKIVNVGGLLSKITSLVKKA